MRKLFMGVAFATLATTAVAMQPAAGLCTGAPDRVTYTIQAPAGDQFPHVDLVEIDVTVKGLCGVFITPPLRGQPETAGFEVFRFDGQWVGTGFRGDLMVEHDVTMVGE